MTSSARTAVVTGGGSGIGAAIVERLRKDGMNVAFIDLSPSADEFGHVADVTDRAAIDTAFDAIRPPIERPPRITRFAWSRPRALSASTASVPK